MKLGFKHRLVLILGLSFFLFFCVVFGSLVVVEKTLENKLSEKIKLIHGFEFQQLGLSLILGQMSLYEVRFKSPKVHLQSPHVRIFLGLSFSDILSLLFRRELRNFEIALDLPRVKIERAQIGRHRSLQDLEGEVQAEIFWRESAVKVKINKIYFRNLARMALNAEIHAFPFSFSLTHPQKSLTHLRSKILSEGMKFEFVAAEGSIQNLGLSQVVLDLAELPGGQLSVILDAALSLFPPSSSSLSSGEKVTERALQAANIFFRTQNEIRLSLRPERPVQFSVLKQRAETEMDLGLSQLGIQWKYE